MNQSKLDWAHAWLGGVADKPSDDAKYIEQLKNELPVLPFLGLPFAEDMIAKLEEHEAFLRGFKHMLLLGIGGSALGPRALQRAFAPGQVSFYTANPPP